jgi:hypothetical protein
MANYIDLNGRQVLVSWCQDCDKQVQDIQEAYWEPHALTVILKDNIIWGVWYDYGAWEARRLCIECYIKELKDSLKVIKRKE